MVVLIQTGRCQKSGTKQPACFKLCVCVCVSASRALGVYLLIPVKAVFYTERLQTGRTPPSSPSHVPACNCRGNRKARNSRSVPTTLTIWKHHITPRFVWPALNLATLHTTAEDFVFALLCRENGSNVAIWLFVWFYYDSSHLKPLKIDLILFYSSQIHANTSCFPIFCGFEPKLRQLWKFRRWVWLRVPSVRSQCHHNFAH